MRKSTNNLIWDLIVLCNERRAVKKLREFEALLDRDFDERAIVAICEYQLSLPLDEFMATGFVGCAA
jgi:predicted transcriptional regulator